MFERLIDSIAIEERSDSVRGAPVGLAVSSSSVPAWPIVGAAPWLVDELAADESSTSDATCFELDALGPA